MNEERARELLQAARAEAQAGLKYTEGSGREDRAAENDTGDIADPAQSLTAEGMDDAIAESLRDRLDALDRAEHRLQADQARPPAGLKSRSATPWPFWSAGCATSGPRSR